MKLHLILVTWFLQLATAGATEWLTQQTVGLATNWNLISFWVQPTNASPEAVFSSLIAQGRLASVFTYERETNGALGVWKRFYPSLPSDQAWLNTLGSVQACQGYWVNVTRGPAANLTITGSATTSRTTTLHPGWNLIGLGNNRRVFWADVFGVTAGGLGAVFVFDTTSRTFRGFNQPVFGPADVNGDGHVETGEIDWSYQNESGVLRQIEVGQGLWVKVGDTMTVGPVLEVEVESDVDPFVPGATTNNWFEPGVDTDLNGNGVLDYGFKTPGQYDARGQEYLNTQDTIWFRAPTGASHSNLLVLRQDITVLNDGLNGSGMLHFALNWDAPWLSASATNGSVLAGPSGQLVTLQADMAGLDVGEHHGTLQVWGNGTNRNYTVKLTVPELDGLYAGEIILTNLQGRLSYPLRWSVQLLLNLQGVSTLQAAGSPSFPDDIVLVNSGSGSDFALSGSVALNPGDAGNPFGVAIQRSVSFRGGRFVPEAEHTAGLNLGLVGEYEEVLTGLPDGPLVLRGVFNLTAKTDKTGLEEP